MTSPFASPMDTGSIGAHRFATALVGLRPEPASRLGHPATIACADAA